MDADCDVTFKVWVSSLPFLAAPSGQRRRSLFGAGMVQATATRLTVIGWDSCQQGLKWTCADGHAASTLLRFTLGHSATFPCLQACLTLYCLLHVALGSHSAAELPASCCLAIPMLNQLGCSAGVHQYGFFRADTDYYQGDWKLIIGTRIHLEEEYKSLSQIENNL